MEKIKEFLEVCQEVRSFITPKNKNELSILDKYEQLLHIINNDVKELQAKKLDPNDPEVKRLIEETIKAQEEILSLKKWDAESMRQIITI